MALIKCHECGKDVSSEAAACPHCGAPVKAVQQECVINFFRKSQGGGTAIKIYVIIDDIEELSLGEKESGRVFTKSGKHVIQLRTNSKLLSQFSVELESGPKMTNVEIGMNYRGGVDIQANCKIDIQFSSSISKKKNAMIWLILLAVIASGFVALYFALEYEEKNDTDIESSIAVSSDSVPSGLSESPSVFESENAYAAPETELEVLEGIDSAITTTLLQAGYSIEHASQIQEILNQVGITSIVIENMTGEAETGLNSVVCYPNGYTDRNRRFFFTTENGVLFYAGFSDEDLYDSEKGGYLKSYEDVHVPETEITTAVYDELRGLAEEDVKSCLNNPQTADFGLLDWGIGRSDDKYQLIGRVSAENSFGVEKEMPFSVWYTDNNGEFTLDGVSIDGVRVK